MSNTKLTSKAEQKARRIIRLLLEKFPKSVVVVTGCYAEVEADSIEKIDSRIAVLKGTAKDALADYPNIIKKYLEENPLYGAKDFADYLKLHFSKVSLKIWKKFPHTSIWLCTLQSQLITDVLC